MWKDWIFDDFCINVMNYLNLPGILFAGLDKDSHFCLPILSINTFSLNFFVIEGFIHIYRNRINIKSL